MKKLIAFLKDEDGLELSEYAVMGALIIAGLAVTIGALGGAIDTSLAGITTTIGGGTP